MPRKILERLRALATNWEARAHDDAVGANADGGEIASIRRAWALARRNDAAELRMLLLEYGGKDRE